MGIIKLTNERAWRTYIGGALIDELHGKKGMDGHFPEEWIMSVTECRNAGRENIKNEGMTRICKTDEFFGDFIKQNPQTLGSAHFEKYGANTGVLIKLIDSAERLSIQVHPNREKARKYFNSDYGKTESWHILGGRKEDNPYIYLGFKVGVTKKMWQEVFDRQDIEKMLDCLNKINVKSGETYLIKGGVPHAIGAGCFLLEVQEPTDYTIRTERITVSGFKISDEMCHQGIGFENMMDCFDYDGFGLEKTIEKYRLVPKKNGNVTSLISYDDTPYFALDMLETDGEFVMQKSDVFCGLYVLDGEGKAEPDGECVNICVGEQYFVPSGTEVKFMAEKKLKIARFFGPKA